MWREIKRPSGWDTSSSKLYVTCMFDSDHRGQKEDGLEQLTPFEARLIALAQTTVGGFPRVFRACSALVPRLFRACSALVPRLPLSVRGCAGARASWRARVQVHVFRIKGRSGGTGQKGNLTPPNLTPQVSVEDT